MDIEQRDHSYWGGEVKLDVVAEAQNHGVLRLQMPGMFALKFTGYKVVRVVHVMVGPLGALMIVPESQGNRIWPVAAWPQAAAEDWCTA